MSGLAKMLTKRAALFGLALSMMHGTTALVSAETRAADPSVTAAAPISLRDRLFTFIRADYLGQGVVSPTATREMYASRIDYFDRGEMSRERVMDEKQAYYDRWTRRSFDMIEGSIKVQPFGDDEVEVFFRYAFNVANAKDQRRGIATATLRVAMQGEQFVIRGEKGSVERRY